MPRNRKTRTRRRIQILFGLLLACILYAEFAFDTQHKPIVYQGTPAVLAADRVVEDPFENLIRSSPLAAFINARDRLVQESLDFVCTFVKQERMPSGITAEQEVFVKFRPVPFSVMMHWTRNAGMARRAIYVKGKWVDESAKKPELRELAVCQPGKIASIFIKSVKQPIHGSMAQRSSRRSIDQFGFKKTLDLIIKYCQSAKKRNELSLLFIGETYFDGRPVWLIRRILPYVSNNGVYPDKTADILIDKQLRIPIAIYCYSDTDRNPQNLLGKYEYRNVRFNTGLTDSDFDPATYGM